MADKKISQLTGATTPLAGTEVLPIVQGGSTVKVAISDVTAGRAVTASTVTVGNARTRFGSSYIADVPGPTGNNTGILFGGNIIFPCDGNGALTNGVASLGSGSYRFNNLHIAGNVVPAAGKGIDFSANTHAAGMTSELLNDYEEGVISIGATCDSGTITLSSNTLYYTKVGRMVHVSGKLVVGSVSSPTGNVYFGLPVAAGIDSAVTLYLSGTNAVVGAIPQGLINAGQSIFYVQTLDQATGNISGAAAIFKAGTTMHFSASYVV